MSTAHVCEVALETNAGQVSKMTSQNPISIAKNNQKITCFAARTTAERYKLQ